MKIVVDTREQKPLVFIDELITEVITTKLEVGDYSCIFESGFSPPFVFERKSVADLFSTLTSGYSRFKREIERAKSLDVKLILIVEGSFSEIIRGFEYSRVKGISIIRTMMTIWVKYGVFPVFLSSREECSRYIIEFYSAIGRKAIDEIKGKKDEQ